ncbi:MAG TPA: hypothetical protein VHP83_20525 [Aggregatilineaceae bacterium]|nr:hypothetical protein [Aggregatilineaceae bacterium]
MTDDWKRKVDERYQQEERRRAQELEEAKRRQDEQHAREQAQRDAELAKKVKQLGKFKCHICGKVSTVPGSETVSYEEPNPRSTTAMQNADGDWLYDDRYVTRSSEQDDYSQPGDLQKCSKCGKWTCAEHLYRDICKNCAEKGRFG